LVFKTSGAGENDSYILKKRSNKIAREGLGEENKKANTKQSMGEKSKPRRMLSEKEVTI